MKCIYHKKDVEHHCIWCGRQICELCIGRQEGRKIYCQKCLDVVGPLKQPLRKPNEEKPRTEDGYVVLGGQK